MHPDRCTVGEFPSSTRCEFRHPQVRPLLERYLPAPAGVPAQKFWECLECYADLIDPVAWATQPGFAAEFEERITTPAAHAIAMLGDATYLTRLYTLISPHEISRTRCSTRPRRSPTSRTTSRSPA